MEWEKGAGPRSPMCTDHGANWGNCKVETVGCVCVTVRSYKKGGETRLQR